MAAVSKCRDENSTSDLDIPEYWVKTPTSWMEGYSIRRHRYFLSLLVFTLMALFCYYVWLCSSEACSSVPLTAPQRFRVFSEQVDENHDAWTSSVDVATDKNRCLIAELRGLASVELPSRSPPKSMMTFDNILADDFSFDIAKNDVMVFLHIQKTGGSIFGRHLVDDLDLKQRCVCHRRRKKRRCDCFRPGRTSKRWLFSRHSTGWKCGLHADWTELTNCVDQFLNEEEGHENRRYFYVTLLREPVSRYLSEFKHVQRGATWKASRHWCAGHEATSAELPPCYEGEDWSDVPLEEFLSCPYNLANNRQTRMLADLSLVGCYNLSRMPAPQRDAMMLASAKQNLEHMASFGITATQKKNQYIFEETFNLRFDVPFEQYEKNSTYSGMTEHQLDDEILNSIRCINHLDVELYKFAAQLLEQRFRVLSTHDAQFEEHFNSLGSPLL